MVPENKFHIKEEKEKVKVLSSCMQFEYSWCLLMLMTILLHCQHVMFFPKILNNVILNCLLMFRSIDHVFS